ncbi:hypothetical protein GCM10007940_42430 [Portibacter lacus]|uniref:Copper-binding protein MbnP-like domain-containing protein n=1 Tax=Portibacter lacus TaxID=1099794 RepID=A0AA37ST36_9BACT|nr:hypothetical protein GCM10007940_42430 [Portibacter lacus]
MIFLATSCYEKQEGCIDFRANNYDFGADKTCEDCCTFPDMKIKVNHNWGDTILFHDSIYTGFMNQQIRIVDAQFFISEVYLTQGDDRVTVLETLDIEDINGNISEIPDNIAFVQSSRFTYDIGTFNQPDIYDGIAFRLGINGNFNSSETEDYPGFFDETNYEYTNFRMRYVLENISTDTITFELNGPETTVSFELDANFELPVGLDFTIPLNAAYGRLLNNVDMTKLSSGAEQSKIISNFNDFLSF